MYTNVQLRACPFGNGNFSRCTQSTWNLILEYSNSDITAEGPPSLKDCSTQILLLEETECDHYCGRTGHNLELCSQRGTWARASSPRQSLPCSLKEARTHSYAFQHLFLERPAWDLGPPWKISCESCKLQDDAGSVHWSFWALDSSPCLRASFRVKGIAEYVDLTLIKECLGLQPLHRSYILMAEPLQRVQTCTSLMLVCAFGSSRGDIFGGLYMYTQYFRFFPD